MDTKREKILIEGGLQSACHKAGKLFIEGEFITCEKFRELFVSSVKLPDIDLINCPSMKYLETDFGQDRRFTFLIDLFTSSCTVYYYRCSFNVTVPGGKHSGSGCYTNQVSVEKWKWDWAVDFNPDEFYMGDEPNSQDI